MKDPTIDLDIDKKMNATLIIGCPECKRKTKLAARNAIPGKSISCLCGVSFNLSGDALRPIQRSLDDLQRTLKSLGQ
ncbi:MAG: hypothetical protein JRJ50_12025 [Deltaproteobacteria bacterium]|nr:hypothetical protein [Deltaproteobacteria bacterium]MBW2342478.1 hypothetical protein [Deltaproteobacteria bacterium]